MLEDGVFGHFFESVRHLNPFDLRNLSRRVVQHVRLVIAAVNERSHALLLPKVILGGQAQSRAQSLPVCIVMGVVLIEFGELLDLMLIVFCDFVRDDIV